MKAVKQKSSKSLNTNPGLCDINLDCEIMLLDPSQSNYIITINIHDHGSILFENVCTQLGGILEKDYFGLRYIDRHGQRQWLELDKSIYKQIREKNFSKSTQIFSFRFKHYPKNPCEDLKQDLSKYLLYLQLRRDLNRGRLIGNSNEQNNLAALILQAEIGGLGTNDNNDSIRIADLKILPHTSNSSEAKILSIHKTLRDLGAKDAEKRFLQYSSKLDTYGVEPIFVKDQKGNQLFVGLVEEGISTFNKSKKSHTFLWQDVLKLSYSQKLFMFQVIIDQKKHVLGFKCESTHAACALWKWSLDKKCFFTLEKGSLAHRSRSGGSIFRRKKIYTFSGMSQKELTQSCENLQVIPQPHVMRSQSMMAIMRNMSSRNESDISNEIDFIEKDYSSLSRSGGMSTTRSDSNISGSARNKRNFRKSKSPSAAVGAVLDFMQALKESPILRRPEINFYSENPDKDEYLISSSTKKECEENIFMSQMIDATNQKSGNMNLKDIYKCTNSNSQNNPIILKNQILHSPYIIISISMLFIAIFYGFWVVLHSQLNIFSETNEMDSFIHWLFNNLGRIIFKEKKVKEN